MTKATLTGVALFLAGIAVGALFLRPGDASCAEHDDDGRCTLTVEEAMDRVHESAYDAGREIGFSEGYEAQLDPCKYWQDEEAEEKHFYESASRPSAKVNPYRESD